jgi:hypothetical protein
MHTPRSRAWLLTHFLRTRRRRALSCLAWPPATATPPPTVSNAGRLNPATCDPACWERLQPLVTHRGELEAATAYILRLQPYLTQATRVTARAATRVTIGWLPQSRRAACAPILPVAACTTAYHCVCTYTYCMCAAFALLVRCVCTACASVQVSVLIAAEACMGRCRRCGRCQFVSFSAQHAQQHVHSK